MPKPRRTRIDSAPYRHALALLESTLSPRQRLLLIRHYEAPERTITARRLAARVGYPSYGTVNLQYGTLARRVCEILGERHRFHVFALVDFEPGVPESDGEWRWVMKPAVARALEELGWVAPLRLRRSRTAAATPATPRASRRG